MIVIKRGELPLHSNDFNVAEAGNTRVDPVHLHGSIAYIRSPTVGVRRVGRSVEHRHMEH